MPWRIDQVVSIHLSYPATVSLQNGEGLTLDVLAAMLDKGTLKQTKADIADKLERVGASISFSSNGDRVDVRARCLARDMEMVLELVREHMDEPAFDERELELVKGRTRAHLARQKSDPAVMGRNRLSRILYSESHPSRELPIDELLASVESCTSDELHAMHGREAFLGGLRATVVGDVGEWEASRVAALLMGEAEFAQDHWNDTGKIDAPAPAPGRHHLEIADRPNLNVLMAHPVDIETTSEYYLPLWTGVFILGGNFSSRLMTQIRDEQGLTYGIRSYLSGMSSNRPGGWMTAVTLSTDMLEKGISSTQEVLAAFADGGITSAELDERKETMTGSYQVDLATTAGVASRMLLHMHRGWAPERIDSHPDIVRAIQTDEVNRAISTYLDASSLSVITAGTGA